ncbi:hypothetical protein BaRGS_00001320, partial [Batillaria attramentaria]
QSGVNMPTEKAKKVSVARSKLTCRRGPLIIYLPDLQAGVRLALWDIGFLYGVVKMEPLFRLQQHDTSTDITIRSLTANNKLETLLKLYRAVLVVVAVV